MSDKKISAFHLFPDRLEAMTDVYEEQGFEPIGKAFYILLQHMNGIEDETLKSQLTLEEKLILKPMIAQYDRENAEYAAYCEQQRQKQIKRWSNRKDGKTASKTSKTKPVPEPIGNGDSDTVVYNGIQMYTYNSNSNSNSNSSCNSENGAAAADLENWKTRLTDIGLKGTPAQLRTLKTYMDGTKAAFTADIIEIALKDCADSDGRSAKYLWTILDGYITDGVASAADADRRRAAHQTASDTGNTQNGSDWA